MDLALADVVATSSDPALGAIRLAWWREQLEELDQGARAPAEPRLRAVAEQLLGRGVTGDELSRLEDAWRPLLDPFPWAEAQPEALKQRGRLLFGVGARLLDSAPRDAETAGELWSLTDGARHCSDPESRELLLSEASKIELPAKAPRPLRSLTVLAVLVKHDLEGGNRSGRVNAAFWHRLRGGFPRQS